MSNIKKIITTFVFVFLLSAAQAADLTVGLAGEFGSSEYKGVKSRFSDIFGYSGPVPYVAFDSKYFYTIFPQEAGIHLFKNKQISLDLTFDVISGLDPNDSDDSAVKQMDKRNTTISAGLKSSIKTPAGVFTTSFRGDILGESDSLLARLSYRYPIPVTEVFTITPAVHISWANDKHNNYRYSVNNAESVRSGLPVYNAAHTLTPSGGLALNYRLNKKASVLLRGSYTFLPSEVKNSPIVDKSGIWEAGFGILYKF
ncbi:outer membrane protein [Elusimicrobium posterum]|uniref:MipA/OmpV family protein n=1 Tax=Elusimicrobium posterum TaxID=3116653 RepID=UPI003C738BA3